MWIPQLPKALLWDHNGYYHPFLLRQLPARMERALDVGCGDGVLARQLSARADHVDAVDVSSEMIDRARRQPVPANNINWLLGDVLDENLPLGRYDAVTAVASLHHMPLRPALERLSDLVKPGGTMVIIGLYRRATLFDTAITALALPANGARGLVLAASGRADKPHEIGMPVKDPDTTLAEIHAAATDLLPDASLRRHLYWRYSLTWRRPA